MAKKSSHGTEIGKIELIDEIRYYMSDGKILRNYGGGIKLFRKINPGVDITDHYNKTIARIKEFDKLHPCFMAYNKELMQFGLQKRIYLNRMIKELYNDPDGLYSELSEVYDSRLQFNFTLDDCIDLCKKYNVALLEAKQKV
jgi:hypothetical protein